MNDFLHDFTLKLMAIDSTTGNEYRLADYLTTNFKPHGAKIEIQQVSKKQKNLFFKWGNPKIIFCTHLDTVPPHIAPSKKDGIIYGRGACDAKGQIAVMYETCRQLYKENQKDFGLLLLADEEKKSGGAKVANKLITGCNYIIVGEPTENKLIMAAKGISSLEVTISGKAAHSGYPENGESAVENFRLFLNKLSKIKFSHDKLLGKTTYNIAQLKASNPINVIPDKLTCKILFRTTFATHNIIQEKIKTLGAKNIKLCFIHNNPPMNFFTVAGFKTGIVSFGSDAPTLNKLGKCLLYGPGNILTAHTKFEQIKVSDLEKSVKQLKILYYKLLG